MELPNSPEHKNRLDVYMTSSGLTRSRSAAADLIKRGKVLVNNREERKASTLVSPIDQITIIDAPRFVSRAGEKLEAALTAWKGAPQNISVKEKIILDVGSSTGGFAQCLLSHGAHKVIAIEVGTDQLNSSLRSEPNIELHEGTDIRRFKRETSDILRTQLADMAVIDVSFISLGHVLPSVHTLLSAKGYVIALVKPQFEVGREIAHKRKGVIRDESERAQALTQVITAAQTSGFTHIAHIDSPLEGEQGNREYLLLLRK